MLELCERNTNINSLSLSLSSEDKKSLSEVVDSILRVRWVMVMGDITSATDTEYEWMMRTGNCIPALLSICKYRIRAEPGRKYKLRLMRSPQDTVLT